MSLILEALRKSEAERRRGQVPDLHAERAPAVAARRATAPAWPWLALALALAVTLAWLARGAWSPTRGGGASAPPDPPASGRDAGIAAGAHDPSAHVPGAGDFGATTAPLPVDRARPQPTPPPPAVTPPPPRAGANPLAATNDSAALPPRIAPVGMPIQDARREAVGTGIGAAPPPLAPPSPRVAVAAASVPASGVATVAAGTTAPPPAPRAAGDANPPLRLSDLGTAERLELPPLKISMHLWDPSPARRFAIIDGARVNEGDRIGDAVVDEITANAVLLAWRGQRLQIPLR